MPNPKLAIDDAEGEILGERRVLQPVVEDEDLGAGMDGHPRALNPIRADESRRDRSQQKGFVANRPGVVTAWIDENRQVPPLAAIAARQKSDPPPLGEQHARKRESRGRLSGASRNEIADADNRNAGIDPVGRHSLRGGASINPANRLEGPRQKCRPARGPEARRLHAERAGRMGSSARIERSTAPARFSTVSPAALAIARSFAALAKSAMSESPRASGLAISTAPPAASRAA